jgi:hypothetical protein
MLGSSFAVAVATSGCSGSCGPRFGYVPSNLQLPANTYSEDCTLTFAGSSNQAVYDCPAPGAYTVQCIPESGAPAISGISRFSPSSSGTPNGDINIAIWDDDASRMQGWLGGPAFSFTVTCGGSVATQGDGQFGQRQFCEG